jgi:tRNA threonylcarbamoyladenosine biosynthesis protein TsaB
MDIYIDTAVKGCNIALFDQGEIFAHVQEPIERGHAEAILPLYEELMQSIGKTPQDIENVYVSVGPGSFTGLRVGLSVARFIGYSLGVLVHGITSFQAFSAHVKNEQDRCVIVETKRSDYYVQMFDENHNALNDPQSISSDDVAIMLKQYPYCIITGDAVDRLMSEIPNLTQETQQQEMISIDDVVVAIQSGDIKTIEPNAFYIRDADVSQPKKKSIPQQHS